MLVLGTNSTLKIVMGAMMVYLVIMHLKLGSVSKLRDRKLVYVNCRINGDYYNFIITSKIILLFPA